MEWETLPTPEDGAIEDVQAQRDERRLGIDAVGIRRLKMPVRVEDAGDIQQTVAEIDCAVELPPERRGTHMSRFVALLSEQRKPVSAGALPDLLAEMAGRLEARITYIAFEFPYFRRKQAPISGVTSYMDYHVCLLARLAGGKTEVTTDVTVPVTSLCPCSKEISAYGAHNQRSHVRVRVTGKRSPAIGELIALVESEASAPLYGLLKRADEKYVTEQAYDTPKFVEDMVRDVALRLKTQSGVEAFRVEVENFESIHNHSAYAVIAQRG